MSIGFMFLFNSVLLGVGLAMDAFSVSLANGLNEPQMGTRRMCGIAGVFAFFQALMPMTGWVCIHTIVSHFQAFEKLDSVDCAGAFAVYRRQYAEGRPCGRRGRGGALRRGLYGVIHTGCCDLD